MRIALLTEADSLIATACWVVEREDNQLKPVEPQIGEGEVYEPLHQGLPDALTPPVRGYRDAPDLPKIVLGHEVQLGVRDDRIGACPNARDEMAALAGAGSVVAQLWLVEREGEMRARPLQERIRRGCP
jgi:hypothetical protein